MIFLVRSFWTRVRIPLGPPPDTSLVELVDTLALGASIARFESSSLSGSTT